MSAADVYWAAPPVSRTLAAAALALSLPAHMSLINLFHFVWSTSRVLTWRAIPQAWRLVTPFILTGPKLGLIFDPYFLYTYGSQLERGSSRFTGPGDFLFYIIFLCTIILFTCGYILDGLVFLPSLSIGLAYTYAMENPNNQINYFFVTFSAKYLPFAMLLLTFVMGSPDAALHQATGLLAAHLYDFLTKYWPEHGGGVSIIHTPLFIRRWFEGPGGTPSERSYGTAFSSRTTNGSQSVPQNQAGRAGGWTSGVSSGNTGGTWNSRGQGHRLGGD